MTREMKNSGVEWIGDIPSEWEIVKVKSIFNIGRGRVIAKTELEDSGYPIYSSQTKNNGILGYIGTYDYDVDQLTWTTDGANAGTVFLRTGKYNCTNVCGTLALKNNLNCLLYMKYALEYIAIFHKRPDTNGYKIMNNEMADIKVTAPPLPEQKRIADFLDSKVTEIDKIISETKASIENYKEYKQSVITEAVTKGLDKNVPMKETDSEWIGQIPSHWKYTRIQNLYELIDIRNTDPNALLLSLYTAIGVRPRNELEEKGNKAITVIDYKKVQKNDVIVNKLLAWMGAIGYSDYEGVTSPDYDVYRSKENANVVRGYYDNYFRHTLFKNDCYKYGHGIMLMRWRTYPEELLRIKVPNPPYQEQISISKYLNYKCMEIDNLISEKEKLITNLEEYKKSLIYEYVTGKKAVE